MPIEWSDRFRSALIAAAASVWAAAFGVAGSGLGKLGDPWHPAWSLVGVAGAVAAAVPAVRARRRWAAGFRAAGWSAATAWVAWAWAAGVEDLARWQALAAGAAVFGLLALGFAVPDAAPGILPGAVQPPPKAGPSDWEVRLATVGKAPGCTVTDRQEWPQRTGYDITGDCPADGTSWEDLKQRERALAASLKLPRGCGVEVGPGADSGGFRVRVATHDTLGEDRIYTDTSELSINRPLPFGRHRDGTTAQAALRQSCVMVVSETGGGKTNFLHTVQADLVRCPDVLSWVIDLGGAGLALPWVAPWLDGEADRPVVDWVAPDLDEALWMTTFAIQIIKQRRAAYRHLLKAADSDLLPVTHGVPAIVISIDETAEAAGLSANPALQQNIVRIIQLGRAVAVRVVLSGLRATSSVLPIDAQRQIGVRAVFGVGDEAEIGHALGWRAKLDLGAAPYPGAGWWRDGTSGPIQVFRTPHTAKPSTIAAIAAACVDRRPALDGPSMAGGDGRLAAAYVARWERVVPLLTGDAQDVPAVAAAGRFGQQGVADLGRPVAGSPDMTSSSGGTGGYDADAVQRKLRTARAEQARDRLAGMPDEYARKEAERLLGELEDERVAPEETPAADPRGRMRELLDAAGAAGISGPKLLDQLHAEGLQVARSTMYEWLKKDAVDLGYGRLVAPHHAGGST